jgi:hypothetical protein
MVVLWGSGASWVEWGGGSHPSGRLHRTAVVLGTCWLLVLKFGSLRTEMERRLEDLQADRCWAYSTHAYTLGDSFMWVGVM